MPARDTTVAQVHHRDVTPWRRDGFVRTLLGYEQVTAVFHSTRQVEVTFRCARPTAESVLDDVTELTRFPVIGVGWDGAQPP